MDKPCPCGCAKPRRPDGACPACGRGGTPPVPVDDPEGFEPPAARSDAPRLLLIVVLLVGVFVFPWLWVTGPGQGVGGAALATALAGLLVVGSGALSLTQILDRDDRIEVLLDPVVFRREGRGMTLHRVRVRERRVHGSPGSEVAVEASLTGSVAGDDLELTVRLEDPEGGPLGSLLPRFRDPEGRCVARQLARSYGRGRRRALVWFPSCAVVDAAGEPAGFARAVLEFSVHGGAIGRYAVALRLPYDPLRLAGPGGVAGDAPAGATCQVCGDEAGAGAVACRACAAPHHKDCWDYLGGCSTFGCAGGPGALEAAVLGPGA